MIRSASARISVSADERPVKEVMRRWRATRPRASATPAVASSNRASAKPQARPRLIRRLMASRTSVLSGPAGAGASSGTGSSPLCSGAVPTPVGAVDKKAMPPNGVVGDFVTTCPLVASGNRNAAPAGLANQTTIWFIDAPDCPGGPGGPGGGGGCGGCGGGGCGGGGGGGAGSARNGGTGRMALAAPPDPVVYCATGAVAPNGGVGFSVAKRAKVVFGGWLQASSRRNSRPSLAMTTDTSRHGVWTLSLSVGNGSSITPRTNWRTVKKRLSTTGRSRYTILRPPCKERLTWGRVTVS